MSAFQDFGPLSERRRAEKQQRRRKHLMFAGASLSVVLILVFVAVAAVHYRTILSSPSSVSSVDGGVTPKSAASSSSSSHPHPSSSSSSHSHPSSTSSSHPHPPSSTSSSSSSPSSPSASASSSLLASSPSPSPSSSLLASSPSPSPSSSLLASSPSPSPSSSPSPSPSPSLSPSPSPSRSPSPSPSPSPSRSPSPPPSPSPSPLSSSIFSPSSSPSPSTKDNNVSEAIQVICSSTDHQNACKSSLEKYANASSTPKDLIRGVISGVVDVVGEAFNRSDSYISSTDPSMKGAAEICREVHGYAASELNSTLSTIDAHRLNELPMQVHEFENWLSAVAAYQQTCIDAFPEGETKAKMQAAMDSARDMTSNALVVVGNISSLLSLLQPTSGSGNRRLLQSRGDWEAAAVLDGDGVPSWVPEPERRILATKSTKEFTPNVTVAKDGSGNFTTISDALTHLPAKYDGRYVIYVKQGVYEETVVVQSQMINITMFGDGSRKTIVTGSKNFVDGVKTFHTATFAAIGDGFLAVAMAFQNTAGAAKRQAVALRVHSDRAIFLNCRMESYQDTLYAYVHRQFYRGCVILGTVDFIFGDAAAVFQNCVLTFRRPLPNQNTIMLAQGRNIHHETTGFVIHNCRLVADDDLASAAPAVSSYIGRPWKNFSHTVVMESQIDGFIHPDGYLPWNGDFALKTLSYKEYGNKGPGAATAKRVNWPGFKVIDKAAAQAYTPAVFLQGEDWIAKTATPVRLGLFGS